VVWLLGLGREGRVAGRVGVGGAREFVVVAAGWHLVLAGARLCVFWIDGGLMAGAACLVLGGSAGTGVCWWGGVLCGLCVRMGDVLVVVGVGGESAGGCWWGGPGAAAVLGGGGVLSSGVWVAVFVPGCRGFLLRLRSRAVWFLEVAGGADGRGG